LTTKIKYPEDELVGLLKQGSRPAFSFLYDNYSRALFGVIKKVIPDDAVAEDLLQDSFVKIWNNRNMYDVSKGRLYTWMLNIARNTSIDYLRSKQNKMTGKIRHDDNTVHEINRMSSIEINTDAIGIKKVVDALKEDQRRLIGLAYYEGYTQEEIAAKLDIPLGTVKTRIRAALVVLRNLVK
jgi:RNA polymerase sigma-70 factor (ECF subfamily)